MSARICCGLERQRGATLRAGVARGERAAAGQFAHLAGELAGSHADDRRVAVEAIAARDLDIALEDKPDRRVAIADVENWLPSTEHPQRAVGKASGGLDLLGVEHGKYLLAAVFDQRHGVP